MATQDACDKAKEVFEWCGLLVPDMFTKATSLFEVAWKQAVEYDFLALTRSSDALEPKGQGPAIRHNIESVWATQSTDKEMVK